MFCMCRIIISKKHRIKPKNVNTLKHKKCIYIETKHSNSSIIASMQANEQISKEQVKEQTLFVEAQLIAVRKV